MTDTARASVPTGHVWWSPTLSRAHYDRRSALDDVERRAIVDLIARLQGKGATAARRRPLDNGDLSRLLRPIADAFDVMGSDATDRRAATCILLRECLRRGRSYWAWTPQDWVTVLGGTSLEFRSHQRPRVSQSVRLDLAGLAYLHGCFRTVLALGHFKRAALAARVFGHDVVMAATARVASRLRQWGYASRTALESCVCEALLLNESPCLGHLTSHGLDRFRHGGRACKRSLYFQVAKALAAERIVEAPLPVAPSRAGVLPASGPRGVPPVWLEWVARWQHTSTLVTRAHLRLHLYKVGRWLAAHHPEVESPADWTRALATDYVAAISRMRIGDYVIRRVTARGGMPLSARTRAAELGALRTFFCDCHEWEWIPRRFDPVRSLAVPRSIKALIGPAPRVIADDVWARLLWAGLHLMDTDLPRAGAHGAAGQAYPLEYVRALAMVWLFAGLRSDEITRLRVGCIRWQQADHASDTVCLLDIPTTKTGTAFTKPVDPQVGHAVEGWERIRPAQPQATDRKTGEAVDFLFMYRARPMRQELLNASVIPILCRKARVPGRDVRGTITSHRARATIASQLFNSREPMSLFELQAWLGHHSPASTQHYVAITPTKLAKAYTDAGYFARNVRAIEVLIDQDTLKQAVAEGEPWRYYDLGHGLCAYEFFDQCAHRMACPRCDFYRPQESTLTQLVRAKGNILRFLHELPLTDEERAVVDGDLAAVDRLTARLREQPTPAGPTPAQLVGVEEK